MSPYQHTQRGTVIRIVLGSAGLFFLGVTILMIVLSEEVAAVVVLAIGTIPMIFLYLFHSLTVELSQDSIVVFFGPGLVRRKIDVQKISEVRVVRNRILYGWGIRRGAGCWIFNVSGLDAVELQFKSGRRFRIGTDDPHGLCDAVKAVLTSA